MTADTKEEKIHAERLACRLAPLLTGGPWTLEPREENRDEHSALVRADGAAILLYVGRYEKRAPHRVGITGRYPRRDGHYYGPSGKDAPCANVDGRRDLEKLAADIGRRFLAEYLPAFDEAAKRKARDDEAREHAGKVARVLGAIVGATPREGRDSWSVYLNGGRVDVSASEPRSAHVRVSVSSISEAVAAAVVAALGPEARS